MHATQNPAVELQDRAIDEYDHVWDTVRDHASGSARKAGTRETVCNVVSLLAFGVVSWIIYALLT